MAELTYYYRTKDGPTGSVKVDAVMPAIGLQRALNKIADRLITDGWTQFAEWRTKVRLEGTTRISGRRYPALTQGGILVVADKVPPARVRIDF